MHPATIKLINTTCNIIWTVRTGTAPQAVLFQARHFEFADDIKQPSSPSLLLRANFLLFQANLNPLAVNDDGTSTEGPAGGKRAFCQ